MDGDTIHLRGTSPPIEGPLTLRNGQRVLGTGARSAELAAFAGVDPLPDDSRELPRGTGIDPVITTPAGDGVVVASGNRLRGIAIGDTSGVALRGSNFGTLAIGGE